MKRKAAVPKKLKVAPSKESPHTLKVVAGKEKKSTPTMQHQQQLTNTRDRSNPSPSVKFLDNPQDLGVIADAKDPFLKKHMRKKKLEKDAQF